MVYPASVPYTHMNVAYGNWACAYVLGGPTGASFINITPSPTQVLSAGATITFTLNFVTPPHVLDHFKCYTIENGEFLWDYVYVEDQFIALEAEVGRAYSFCNPVKKTYEDEVTEINNYDHHLTTYGLVYEGVENPQKWSVQVDNQFGVQQMIVEGPKGIAVPTQKLEPGGHGPPVGLDHFMLYDVVHATSVDVHVDLDDEFADHSGVLVTSPIMLANPVRKTDAAGMVTDIQMGEHLVFYYISQVPVNYPQVRVVNQFGEQTFAMYHTDFFGVPSDKISFEPYEEPESLALDHFACYNLSQTSNVTFITPPPWQVYVEDQFIAGGAEVGLPLRFCNPTEKTYSATVTPILDADHHLTVYSLEWCAVVGQWSVQFKNQFGTQQLTVQGPVALAVPTQKLEPGDHDPPGGLDHFLLYDVLLGGGTMWLVNLHDEFGYQPNVDVLAPLYFANPVKKTDAAGMVTEIQSPEAHLVFYDTSVANLYTYPQATGVDQFAQWYHVNLDGPWHLAVPSEKLSWQQQPLGWMPYWWTP